MSTLLDWERGIPELGSAAKSPNYFGDHGRFTAHSKRYIKSSHYISTAGWNEVIHESGYLFTSCRLRAKKNSFKLTAVWIP
ncbi:MAG: hypothetical protein JWO45_2038 [Spartobacteria bacterium]|nr:hypothetical protein [Spartobacteria bacterium]